MIEYALLLTFPMAMAFAAANDLFTMKIPNKISLVLIVCFALAALYIRMPVETALQHLGVGAAALAAGVLVAASPVDGAAAAVAVELVARRADAVAFVFGHPEVLGSVQPDLLR